VWEINSIKRLYSIGVLRGSMSKIILGKGGVVIAETRELVVCEHCGKETEPEDLNYMNWHCPYCHEKIAD